MKEETIIEHNHVFNPILDQRCSDKLKGEGMGIIFTPIFFNLEKEGISFSTCKTTAKQKHTQVRSGEAVALSCSPTALKGQQFSHLISET